MAPVQDAPSAVRRYVYGLEVESTVPIHGATAPRRGTHGRRVSIVEVSRPQLARAWRPKCATHISDQRARNGRRLMTVDYDDEIGYRIDAPRYGTHLISRDGREIRSVLPSVSVWRWYKLLFGQVLPLASALQGLPVFHASAVAFDRGVLGFVASSGTGKSSIALQLIARGARFVTDDVTVLEPTANDILVHPGPGIASLHAAELRELNSTASGVMGEVLGRSEKVDFTVTPIDRALPLAALFLLHRSAQFDRLEITRDLVDDPSRLLASSFIASVKVPAFLFGHLDVCARMAQAGVVFEVSIPVSMRAKEVAAAIAGSAGP